MLIIATSLDMQQEVEQFSPLLPSYPLFAYQMNDSAFLILILYLYFCYEYFVLRFVSILC